MTTTTKGRVFVPGGAGYVGAVLVPRLLELGYEVHVLDLYIYGDAALASVKNHPRLRQFHGDVRDQQAVRAAVEGCDKVIHLACISNDPSVELDANLSETVNYESFLPLVRMCKEQGVWRFIFASLRQRLWRERLARRDRRTSACARFAVQQIQGNVRARPAS